MIIKPCSANESHNYDNMIPETTGWLLNKHQNKATFATCTQTLLNSAINFSPFKTWTPSRLQSSILGFVLSMLEDFNKELPNILLMLVKPWQTQSNLNPALDCKKNHFLGDFGPFFSFWTISPLNHLNTFHCMIKKPILSILKLNLKFGRLQVCKNSRSWRYASASNI